MLHNENAPNFDSLPIHVAVQHVIDGRRRFEASLSPEEYVWRIRARNAKLKQARKLMLEKRCYEHVQTIAYISCAGLVENRIPKLIALALSALRHLAIQIEFGHLKRQLEVDKKLFAAAGL